MTTQAKNRKIKKSYTLSPECVAFVAHSRLERGAGSDSEALDEILRKSVEAQKLQALEDSFTAYYDSMSEDERIDQLEWAQQAGRSLWLGVPD